MEFLSIQDLLKRRRRLVKDQKPLSGFPGWTAEDEEERVASLKKRIADIDQQIAEHSGNAASGEQAG